MEPKAPSSIPPSPAPPRGAGPRTPISVSELTDRLSRQLAVVLRKEKVVAVTAVARELVGFVWAVMHDDPRLWSSRRP